MHTATKPQLSQISKSKPYNLGIIVRADNTGLGAQTWELTRHLKPCRVLVIDLNQINETIGKNTAIHLERFEKVQDVRISEGIPNGAVINEFLQDLDVVLTVETPYNYYLFERARELGVKSILQFNYEFLDYLQQSGLPFPDLFLAPSTWNLDLLPPNVAERTKYIPVPVNRNLIKYEPRKKAKTFLHIAGHKTYMDRNGTMVVMEALKHIKSDVKIVVKSQQTIEDWEPYLQDPRLQIVPLEAENYWDNYQGQEDVLLLPRRYGGLSLQRDEALAHGMPVIMPDCSPNSALLPKGMLIPVKNCEIIQTRTELQCWMPDPIDLALKIDELAEKPGLVAELSRWANRYSNKIAWSSLKPAYTQAIQEVLHD